jgi:hypothetical protein
MRRRWRASQKWKCDDAETFRTSRPPVALVGPPPGLRSRDRSRGLMWSSSTSDSTASGHAQAPIRLRPWSVRRHASESARRIDRALRNRSTAAAFRRNTPDAKTGLTFTLAAATPTKSPYDGKLRSVRRVMLAVVTDSDKPLNDFGP